MNALHCNFKNKQMLPHSNIPCCFDNLLQTSLKIHSVIRTKTLTPTVTPNNALNLVSCELQCTASTDNDRNININKRRQNIRTDEIYITTTGTTMMPTKTTTNDNYYFKKLLAVLNIIILTVCIKL